MGRLLSSGFEQRKGFVVGVRLVRQGKLDSAQILANAVGNTPLSV